MTLWDDVLQSVRRESETRHGEVVVYGDGTSLGLYTGLLARYHPAQTQDTGSSDAGTTSDSSETRTTAALFPLHRAVEVRLSDDVLDAPVAEVELVHLSPLVALEQSYTRQRLARERLVLVIQLDWRTPEAWIERLLEVLKTVQKLAEHDDADAQARTKAQERRRRFVQSYREPSEVGIGESRPRLDDTAAAAAAAADDHPLPAGTLEHNLGPAIVVVCINSHLVDEYIASRRLRDYNLDHMAQILRTVLLLYGASLHYIHGPMDGKHPGKDGLDVLDNYLLHLMFHDAARQEALFAFQSQAEPLAPNAVLIPSGWDSQGKILALNADFDVPGTLAAWQDALTGSVEPLRKRWQTAVPVAKFRPAAVSPAKANVDVVAQHQRFLATLFARQEAERRRAEAEADEAEGAGEATQYANEVGTPLSIPSRSSRPASALSRISVESSSSTTPAPAPLEGLRIRELMDQMRQTPGTRSPLDSPLTYYRDRDREREASSESPIDFAQRVARLERKVTAGAGVGTTPSDKVAGFWSGLVKKASPLT